MSRSMGGILRRGVGSVESVSLRVGVVCGRSLCLRGADSSRRRPLPFVGLLPSGGKSELAGHFKSLMKKAGVEGRQIREGGGLGRKTPSISFHSLRHTFVSLLASPFPALAPEE